MVLLEIVTTPETQQSTWTYLTVSDPTLFLDFHFFYFFFLKLQHVSFFLEDKDYYIQLHFDFGFE